MKPVVSCAEMRAFDAHAIDTCKVPSLVLMENAGRGAAELLAQEALGSSFAAKVLVACGTGNNGGDGFVVARHLAVRGYKVEAWLFGDPARLTPDALVHMEAFAGIGGSLVPFALGSSLRPFELALDASHLVVDALLGTGLDRAVTGSLAEVVRRINQAACPKASLDVPSGMNADTGAELGVAIVASLTVTFGHPKLGLFTPSGAHLAGAVHVVDIGVPGSLLPEVRTHLLEAGDVRAVLPRRPPETHKYRAGHVAVLAGSPGKVGAALLSARGALRGGAGAATIVTWPEASATLEGRVAEIMVTSLSTNDDALADTLDAALVDKRSVVLGPGFGLGPVARRAVDHVLATYAGPMVFDADALSMHAGSIATFEAAGGRAVLTPHAGELARLLGTTSALIESDRFAAVRSAASRANAVVVLKGAYTLIGAPDGRVVVNTTGNAALATAGSGDVLSGLVGALLCTLSAFDAACVGVHLHGAVGDAWREAHADRGLLASDLADGLPDAFGALT